MRIATPNLQAIQRATHDLDTRAARLATSGATIDAADDLAGMQLDRHEVALNADVIRVQNDTLGTLLDLLA